MEKYAWKARILPGKLEEYTRWHDEIWPEMVNVLRSGIPGMNCLAATGVRIFFKQPVSQRKALLWDVGMTI